MFLFRDSQKLCSQQHQLRCLKAITPEKVAFSFLATQGESICSAF